MKNGSDSHRDSDEESIEENANRETSQQEKFRLDGWIKRNFKKCECIRFVPSRQPGDEEICQCGRKQGEHDPGRLLDDLPAQAMDMTDADTQELSSTWSQDADTRQNCTDAFGEIEFPARFTINRAKFIRLAYDTEPSLILDLLAIKWGLNMPQLVISVIGGQSDFTLSKALQHHFSTGLIKAASTAGAWIFTHGTNYGVTKVVGKAIEIHNSSSQSRITAIGFTSWGTIKNREIIRKTRVAPYMKSTTYSQYSVQLENNHSHFILVDDGTVGKVGGELHLRISLENHIAQQNLPGTPQSCNIPIVLLLLEGTSDCISKILASFCQEPPASPFPIVIVEGSGGAADLLAFAYKHSDSNGLIPKYRKKLAKAINRYFGLVLNHEEKSQILSDVIECMNYRHFITVHSFERIGSNDIDVSLLSAILRVTQTNENRGDYPLHLAIAWNRVDLAKDHIFLNGSRLEEFTLQLLMFEVLKKNQVDFVKLIIEQGLDINIFLTVDKLEKLYNCVINEEKEQSPTLLHMLYVSKFYLKKIEVFNLCHVGFIIEMLMGGNFESIYKTFYMADSGSNSKLTDFRNRHLQLMDLIELSSIPSQPHNLSDKNFVDPYVELMTWSILTKRHQLALFFCQQGQQAMAKALTAANLYQGMARVADASYNQDGANLLNKHAERFSDLAVDLLEVCYACDPRMTHRVCLTQLPNWDQLTLIDLADAAQNMKFISHPACQNLLTNLWLGYFAVGRHTILKPILVMLSGLFPPVLLTLDYRSQIGGTEVEIASNTSTPSEEFKQNDSLINGTNQKKRRIVSMQSMLEEKMELISPEHISALSTLEKLQAFYSAPSSTFWRNMFTYIIFLVCVTLVVLTNPESAQWKNWGINYLETLCCIFVLSLLVEELRRMICQKNARDIIWKLKLWSQDIWAMVNMVAFLLFFLGRFMRFQYDHDNLDDINYYGRVFYGLSIVFFYLHFLEFFKESEYYGTMITMIGIMRRDTIFFCVILLVYLLAYGVSTTVMLYPFGELSESTLYSVFFVPYWQFFGELFLDQRGPNFCHADRNEANTFINDLCDSENCTTDDCTIGTSGCHPDCNFGQYMVPIMMALYLIFSNILLLNMLIAIYSNIFSTVQENSTTIWKYQRYKLITKYTEMPPIIPPFILIYHAYLIARWLTCKITGKSYKYRGIPNLNLSGSALERLRLFEMSCVDDYCREKNNLFIQQTDQRIKNLSEKMDRLLLAQQYEAVLEFEGSEEIEGSRESMATNSSVDVDVTSAQVGARLDRMETMLQKTLDIVMKLQEKKEAP